MTVGLRAVSRVKMTILRQAQRHFLPLQKPPGISLKAHAGDVPQTLLSAAPRLRPFEVTGILDLTSALLGRIQQAGIPAVEIFCARQHLDYRDKAQIAELGHWFRDSDLKLHSLHSPMFSDEIWGRSGPHAVVTITEPVKGKRLQMVDEIKRALEISETIPF